MALDGFLILGYGQPDISLCPKEPRPCQMTAAAFSGYKEASDLTRWHGHEDHVGSGTLQPAGHAPSASQLLCEGGPYVPSCHSEESPQRGTAQWPRKVTLSHSANSGALGGQPSARSDSEPTPSTSARRSLLDRHGCQGGYLSPFWEGAQKASAMPLLRVFRKLKHVSRCAAGARGPWR